MGMDSIKEPGFIRNRNSPPPPIEITSMEEENQLSKKNPDDLKRLESLSPRSVQKLEERLE
jgi:hypothetical protein